MSKESLGDLNGIMSGIIILQEFVNDAWLSCKLQF
jgi:hypothetical protein